MATERPPLRRKLGSFTGTGYDKGRGTAWCVAWAMLFEPLQRSVVIPPGLRIRILRLFGAQIHDGVLIRHHVRIHWPWKLTVGRDSWVGVGAYFLNLEEITIGSDVCISQQAMLCTGSHRADDPAFEFDNAPIHIEDGAWIATRATVLRGVTVGHDAVVGATALVVRNVPPYARVLAPPSQTVTGS